MPQTYFFSLFQALMMNKLRCKFYNKQIATHGNGNFQYHDPEESKLNIIIISNSGADTLTDDQMIKSPFNKKM